MTHGIDEFGRLLILTVYLRLNVVLGLMKLDRFRELVEVVPLGSHRNN